MKFDFDSKQLQKGEGKSQVFYSVSLVGLAGFGVWFAVGGYKIVLSALLGVLGL